MEKITLGIDVSKDTLDIYRWQQQHAVTIANDGQTIRKFLTSLSGPVQIAIEPTSSYHLEMVDQAHGKGHEVYLVNPRRLVHYRDAVGERNKTDATDAWLLARYLERERDELRPHTPPSGDAQRLWTLVKRRALVVKLRQQLRQGMAGVLSVKAAQRELTRVLTRIEQQMTALVRQLGWWQQYRHCLTIPGIGPANAAALVAAFHRGAFSGADAFIAYLGMDIRRRESGTHKGKAKLSKNGEAELRRLLWCAAVPSRCYSPFAAYHQAQLDKGMTKIAANVALARKLARIAFALLRDGKTFKKIPQETCMNP
ncbi:MAG: transposase [Pseudomonadota bacterium]